MKTLLVPIDFSPVTDAVIGQAAQLAQAFGSALWLLYVAATDPDFVGYEAGPGSVRQQVAHELHDIHRRLQAHAQALRQQGVDATGLQIEGAIADTILREAQRLGADCIVLGSHGHGALRRALLGSVSEAVLHRATCPVLVLPARQPAG